MIELFVIGSETVSFYKGNYYITGPGYGFKVILYDNTYYISGNPRYKETIQFLNEHLDMRREVN